MEPVRHLPLAWNASEASRTVSEGGALPQQTRQASKPSAPTINQTPHLQFQQPSCGTPLLSTPVSLPACLCSLGVRRMRRVRLQAAEPCSARACCTQTALMCDTLKCTACFCRSECSGATPCTSAPRSIARSSKLRWLGISQGSTSPSSLNPAEPGRRYVASIVLFRRRKWPLLPFPPHPLRAAPLLACRLLRAWNTPGSITAPGTPSWTHR